MLSSATKILSLTSKKIDKVRIEKLLASRSLFFLYPYFGLYCIWKFTNWPVQSLVSIFVFLHFAFFFFGSWHLLSKIIKKTFDSTAALFWLLIFIAFLIPGVYLEYPADPFEHFRRIVSWRSSETIASNSLWTKSFYFWYWSWLELVPIELRRHMLSLISAMTQLILALQVFSLARAFGFDKKYSYLQVVAFIGLFGTSIFGFRYYALATTILAYAAYLRGVELLISGWRSKSRKDGFFKVLELLLISAFIALNHLQELLFLIIAALLVVTYVCATLLHKRSRFLFSILLAFLTITGIGFGAFAKIYSLSVFGIQPPIFLNSIGSFNIFAPTARVINTLGAHGFISIAAAAIFFSRAPLLSIFTIAPFGLLLFPPSFILFSNFLDSENTTYRLLFLFPTSFMFVYALQQIIQLFKMPSALLVAFSLIVVAGLIPSAPWYGRLLFQFHQPTQVQQLKHLDVTAQWFIENQPQLTKECFIATDYDVMKITGWEKKLNPNKQLCVIIADPITSFSLTSHFGLPYWMARLKPKVFGDKLFPCNEMVTFLTSPPFSNSSAILLPIRSQVQEGIPSYAGGLSKHWRINHADISAYLSPKLDEAATCLAEQKWEQKFVPPYYILFQPRPRTIN